MLQRIFAPFYSKNSSPLPLVRDEFTGCTDLPMSRFIKVTTTGDLSHLGRCKNPEALWEAIHSEYSELSGDTQASQGLQLAKQITTLQNRINITNLIVNYLSLRGRVDELVQELKNMGFRLKFIDLAADLPRVLSLSKSDHVKLAAAQSAYDKMEGGEKTTTKDWYMMLSSLAKHRGVANINPEAITVMEYICMQNEFKDYCKYMSNLPK